VATAHAPRAILTGIAAGFATCVVYPLLIAVPLPDRLAVVLAALMGPLLGIASFGLREFIRLDQRRLGADLGALLNALAGALLTAMLLVQIAVGMRTTERVSRDVVGVWLGLDVAWDVYIGLGTLAFGLAMLRHPRLGVPFGASGALIALALLALNLWSFPAPPGESGLVDLGPLVGLWYLAVTLRMAGSLRWVRERAAAASAS
jgi:hypothetical protein